MRHKAIRDLTQLTDEELFQQISAGYKHVLNNALRINNDAQLLREQERTNGCLILSGIAEEEAAKCLILIDAIRCPRQSNLFSQQLGRFNDHLAKGLYAAACYWAPTDLEELASYINDERKEFYLDGPDDFNWIFYNRIISYREQTIYVDYVATDDGNHYWNKPEENTFFLSSSSEVLRLAQAFNDTGCTSPEALQLIAKFWRPIEMSPNFKWMKLRELNYQTLKILDENKLLREQPQSVFNRIVDIWPFPMYSLDLQLQKGNQ